MVFEKKKKAFSDNARVIIVIKVIRGRSGYFLYNYEKKLPHSTKPVT